MSTFAGEVSTIQGVVRAVNPETGEARVLEKGSPVNVGEVIETSSIGGVLINMQNGSQLTLGRDTQMLIDGDVADNASVLDAPTEGAVDVAALQQAVLEGNFDALEATAAGDVAVAPGSASDGGVTVSRVGAHGEVTSGFETSTQSPATVNSVGSAALQIDSVLTIADVSVNEGAGTATVTGTLNVAPINGPLVISLDNGATITFNVGETTAISTPFAVQGDDVYIDAENLAITATVQSGGEEFATLNVSDTATVTVNDTIDDTTVSLSVSPAQITEDATAITYTATVDNATDTAMTVTLSDGTEINIPAGQTSGSTEVAITPDSDVFAEADGTISATIAETTGGNFENVEINPAAASTTVVDSINDTTVSLSATKSTGEDGGSITYTATLDNAAHEDVTVTLDNGESITIKAAGTDLGNGQTADGLSGSVKIDVNQDDVYKETDSISNSITGVSGGASFEKLTFDDAKVSTTIKDDSDAVTVKITGDKTVTEGTVATYHISVNEPTATDMTVTVVTGYIRGGADLDDFTAVKQQVVIKAGDSIPKDSHGDEITISVNTTDDSYVEGSEAYKVSISETSGGGFEAVTIGDSVVTTISDEVQSYSDKFTAVEDGHEFVASEDEGLDNKTEAVIASGNLLKNDELGQDGTAVIDSITLANNFSIQDSDSNSLALTSAESTVIVLDSNDEEYGTLKIDNSGQFTFEVNQSNSSVESLNVDDTSAFDFGYSLTGDTATGLTAVTITTEGRDDAPVIELVTANNQSVRVVSGLLDGSDLRDGSANGIADKINPKELTESDKGLIFSSNNGNLQIDLGYTPSNIAVEFNGGQAGYHNAVGYYSHNDKGALVAKIIYVDNSSYVGPESIDAGTLNDLSGEVGFFIIPNGGSHNITTDSDIVMSSDGTMTVNVNGQAEPVTAYYTDNNLNADGHDHVIAGPAEDGSGLVIGFEDLSLGDRDYDDFVMTVKMCSPLGAENTILSDINLSDVDDASLESATVTLANYMDGDVIKVDNLPDGIAAQIVGGVVELTGTASVVAYEQALESLTFESNSEDRTPREFEFTVFDGDKHSNTMDVTVDIGGCSLNTSVADAPFVSIAVGEATASGAAYDAYAYNGDNFMTGNGNSLGSLNVDGDGNFVAVNETAIFTEYGVGIQNNRNESESGIDDNESLLIDLKSETTSATFNLNVPNNESFEGGWIAFDANQNEIASGHANFTSTGNTAITIKDIGDFQYIAFDAHTSNGNASDSGFYVEPVSRVVNNQEVALGTTTSVDYQLDIEAALTDRDGSESLSVTILGVPTDATLSDGVDNDDNTWTLSVPAGELDYSSSLTLTVPEDTEDFSLRAVATATEGNGGDTATTEVDALGDSFLHGSTEDEVFMIQNDTHESSVTHIEDFNATNDTLDLSEVIDTSEPDVDLSKYLNFSLVDTDNDNQNDSTKISIDSNGAEDGGDITDIYVQDNKDINDISDLNIDYQNE